MRVVTVLRILAVITVSGLAAEQPSGNDPRGEFYRISRDLFEQAAPPEIRVLYAFPSREEWDFQVGRLERALAGGSLNELAALASEARPALGALRLVPGSEEIADWLERMTLTGIRSEGIVYLAGAKKYARDTFTIFSRAITMGQEVGVTGMQMITAVAVIANGGNLVRPQIIHRVLGSDGSVKRDFKPEVRRRVVREAVAADVAEGLLRGCLAWYGDRAELRREPLEADTSRSARFVPRRREARR